MSDPQERQMVDVRWLEWVVGVKSLEGVVRMAPQEMVMVTRWLGVVRMAPQEMLWLLSPFLTTTLAPLLPVDLILSPNL
ncbi:hypothetical protein L596_027977 [Steinernema carpocapsae]|uniref:Uncharacterized protein n=1 Tax=Steinernema carpocapsae TaxID=34508 RepID=A0A4U5LX57_STECR|nr:hypothetical protein L596_027977 [Steinernema carpocapsae]